jgi:predicted RNase H-like nuclease
MTPELQQRIKEIHPELSFLAANGRPMSYSKKKVAGRQERFNCLKRELGRDWERWYAQACTTFAGRAAVDDILDASVAAWTAHRIAHHSATRVPEHPPVDSRGLYMEMWY